jgi:hypothetical protein
VWGIRGSRSCKLEVEICEAGLAPCGVTLLQIFDFSVSDFRSLSAARLIGFSGAAFFYRGQHTSWVG